MTSEEKLGWLANLPRLDAQAQIKRGDYEPSDPDAVQRLFLLAYEDKAKADKAYSKAVQIRADMATKR